MFKRMQLWAFSEHKSGHIFSVLEVFFVLDVDLVIELTCYLKTMDNFAPSRLLWSNKREDCLLSLIHAGPVQ